MPSGKLCLGSSQKHSKTTRYESQVQSNTRADFKLTYIERELSEVMKNLFGEEGVIG